MLNPHYLEMLGKKSVIREMSVWATNRAAEIGAENVFNYSLGNPSVPAPQAFTDEMLRLLQSESPMALHGYSPTLGIQSVRQAVADSLKARFGVPYEAKHIFMTSGAAGAVAHAVRAVTQPGDVMLTFAPYFPEYNPYIGGTGVELQIVPASIEDFQIQFDAFEAMLTPKVTSVLVNTPNNPSGVVYTTATLQKLAAILRAKGAEYGHPIYLISDEPYREIQFAGVDGPFVASQYEHTLTCYSFSKSLSLPGERIGYVAVNPAAEGADLIADMCGQISRETGHNCPPSIIQLAVSKVLDQTSDLSVYETNMNLLYNELTSLGFRCVKPGGTFYIFPQALEPDAVAFCERAKQFNLVLVPSNNFGVPGHFRMAYCVDTETVERSLPALRALAASYR
ncbi:MAG: pyridoxal phosphate-dependent aminotransferase [Oscillospiraceae bacterium]|nr:pyridoxal phosphate-dependent aminotransferase [Oscillospiraceae bacterium]